MASSSQTTQASYEKSIVTGSFFKPEPYLALCENDEDAKRLVDGCKSQKLSRFLNPPISEICYENLITFWKSATYVPGLPTGIAEEWEADKIVASINGKKVVITEEVIHKRLKLSNKGHSTVTLVEQDLEAFWAIIVKPEHIDSSRINCQRSVLKTPFNEFGALIGKTIEGKLGANHALTETRMRLMGIIYNNLEFNWAGYFFLRLREQIEAEERAVEKGVREKKEKRGHFWVKKSYGLQLHYLLTRFKVQPVQLHRLHDSKVMFTYVKQQKKEEGEKKRKATAPPTTRPQRKSKAQRQLLTEVGQLVDEEDAQEGSDVDRAPEAEGSVGEEEQARNSGTALEHEETQLTGVGEESPEKETHVSAIDIDDRIAEYLVWKEGDSRAQLQNADHMFEEEAWLFKFLGINSLVGLLDEFPLWNKVEAAKAKMPQISDKRSDESDNDDAEGNGDDDDISDTDDDSHDDDDDDDNNDDDNDDDDHHVPEPDTHREEDTTTPDAIDDDTLLSTFLKSHKAPSPAKTDTQPMHVETPVEETVIVDTGSAAATPVKALPGTEIGGMQDHASQAHTSTQVLEELDMGEDVTQRKDKGQQTEQEQVEPRHILTQPTTGITSEAFEKAANLLAEELEQQAMNLRFMMTTFNDKSSSIERKFEAIAEYIDAQNIAIKQQADLMVQLNTNINNNLRGLKNHICNENEELAMAIGVKFKSVTSRLDAHQDRFTSIESKLDSLIGTAETTNQILLQQKDDVAKKGEKDKPEGSTAKPPTFSEEQIRARNREMRIREEAEEQQKKAKEEREKAQRDPCIGFPYPVQRRHGDRDEDRSGRQQSRPGSSHHRPSTGGSTSKGSSSSKHRTYTGHKSKADYEADVQEHVREFFKVQDQVYPNLTQDEAWENWLGFQDERMKADMNKLYNEVKRDFVHLKATSSKEGTAPPLSAKKPEDLPTKQQEDFNNMAKFFGPMGRMEKQDQWTLFKNLKFADSYIAEAKERLEKHFGEPKANETVPDFNRLYALKVFKGVSEFIAFAYWKWKFPEIDFKDIQGVETTKFKRYKAELSKL